MAGHVRDRGPYLHSGAKHYIPFQVSGLLLPVDPAATAKIDPDVTVVSAWASTPCELLVRLGCKLVQCEIPDIPPVVAEMYDKHQITVVLIEGFSIGKGPAQLYRRYELVRINVVE